MSTNCVVAWRIFSAALPVSLLGLPGVSVAVLVPLDKSPPAKSPSLEVSPCVISPSPLEGLYQLGCLIFVPLGVSVSVSFSSKYFLISFCTSSIDSPSSPL